MVTASMEVTSDFPTPPLPLTIPITFLMLLISCGFTEKSFFFSFLSAQSSEQLLQLWLQFSLIILAPSCIFFMHGCYAVDRKSTRLNSSHVRISYAVFCLKKKKKKQ